MNCLLYSLLSLSCCGVFVPEATAQNQAVANMMGNVQSATKESLSGASIIVVHMPSSIRRTASTDDSGNFAIGDLPVGGPYTVLISEPRFEKEIVNNVFLQAGKTANATFMLRPGPKSARAAKRGRNHSSASPNDITGYTSAQPQEVVASTAPATPFFTPAPAAAPATPVTASKVDSKPTPARINRSPARRYPPQVVVSVVSGRYDDKTRNYIYDTGALTELQLPDGKKITGVGINSTESLLYGFLADPAVKVDTEDLSQGWINLDRVFFERGKATLTKESMAQLKHIATIMKGYSTVRIKIGGYTDSTGTYKVNRLLSETRARTARTALVRMGVSSTRLEAQGYGSNYSISDNRTEEGRAMNRRLSVKVLAK